jgi:hypothetical protein
MLDLIYKWLLTASPHMLKQASHKCFHSVLLARWEISIKNVSGDSFVVSMCEAASFVSAMWNHPASESIELCWQLQHFEQHRSRQVNFLQTFSACELPFVRKTKNHNSDFKLLRDKRGTIKLPLSPNPKVHGRRWVENMIFEILLSMWWMLNYTQEKPFIPLCSVQWDRFIAAFSNSNNKQAKRIILKFKAHRRSVKIVCILNMIKRAVKTCSYF